MGLRIGETTEGKGFIYDSSTDELIGRLWHEDEDSCSGKSIATEFLQDYLGEEGQAKIRHLTPTQLEEKVKAFHQWRNRQQPHPQGDGACN